MSCARLVAESAQSQDTQLAAGNPLYCHFYVQCFPTIFLYLEYLMCHLPTWRLCSATTGAHRTMRC